MYVGCLVFRAHTRLIPPKMVRWYINPEVLIQQVKKYGSLTKREVKIYHLLTESEVIIFL